MIESVRAPLLLAVLIIFAACGEAPVSDFGTPPDDPLSYMGYSCYGDPPAYRLDDPYDRDEIPRGARAALERVQESSVSASGPAEADQWDAVVRTKKIVVFLYERRGADFPYSEVTVRRTSKGWRFGGSGDCKLWAIPKRGWSSSDWWLAEEPQPQDRHLVIRASERDCTSGRKLPPEGFDPVVHYDQGRISIAVFSEPLEAGFYNCPGNPSTELTIKLDEPVGTREIFDVGVFPPRLVDNDARQ